MRLFFFSAAPIAFADDAKDLEQAFGDLAKVLAEHRDTNSDTEVDSKNRVIADSNFLKLAKQNKEATAKLLVGQLGKKENLNLILVMQQAPAPTYVEPLNKHYGLFKDEGFKVVYRQEVLKTIAAAGKDSLPALLKVIEARAGVDIRKDEFSINQFAADQDFRTSVKLIGTIPSAKSEKNSRGSSRRKCETGAYRKRSKARRSHSRSAEKEK